MVEEFSIEEQIRFKPPFCPNEDCTLHLFGQKMENNSDETVNKQIRRQYQKIQFYRSKGWSKRDTFPHRVRRYKCKVCSHSFGLTSFKLDYRQKKPGLNPEIFSFFTVGASNREIGRRLNCSEHLVRGRLKTLAQWALLRQTELSSQHQINEPIVYDGLENFAKSQYEPNQIQHAIGKSTLFIHDFNFCPINRKGRMSAVQKKIRDYQYETIGRFPTSAIRISSCEIFRRLFEKRKDKNKPLVLCSDEHFQYRRAVQYDLKDCNIEHITISSKDYRNYMNLLFPVNHSDLLTRQHIAAFRRETIAFSKTHSRMIQKFALFMIWKNFLKPQVVKKQKINIKSNLQSPAMAAGLVDRILSFEGFFDQKRSLKQVPLNREWKCYYHEIPTYSRELKTAAQVWI
jgi:hypothetical protein